MLTSDPKIDIYDAILKDSEKNSKSILMKDIFYKILRLAKLDSHVIVVGEIGSGKRRLAQIIHENSNRADYPFHSFYCIDVSEKDYKDAFWGHLEFGENNMVLKYDALEKASNGILYLDQFSELPISYMEDILKSYQKGCSHLFRYNKAAKPRLIISLNQESYQDILHEEIWENLLEQLNPVVIMLPPLRERREDIPMLIDYQLGEIKKGSKDFEHLRISEQALNNCLRYDWPGNILQLKNALLQGAILSHGQLIEPHHLPFSMSWKLPYQFNRKSPSN
jgi:DNA-binding NtrC family response regulator